MEGEGIISLHAFFTGDWTFHATELSQHAKDSEKTTTRPKRLKKAGYLKRYPIQNSETGKFHIGKPLFMITNHRYQKP
nr:hypothetical protein [Bacillus thuringiensis]